MNYEPPASSIQSEIFVSPGYLPNPEELVARPYELFGFWVLMLAFVLFLTSALVLAIKARLPGAWLSVLGLLITLVYFVFQVTIADWGELRYGPWADAVALIAYGTGALFFALGYTRMAFHLARYPKSLK